jgi:hypothetical protein
LEISHSRVDLLRSVLCLPNKWISQLLLRKRSKLLSLQEGLVSDTLQAGRQCGWYSFSSFFRLRILKNSSNKFAVKSSDVLRIMMASSDGTSSSSVSPRTVIQVLVAAVGDSSLAVQEAAAAALRNNAQQNAVTVLECCATSLRAGKKVIMLASQEQALKIDDLSLGQSEECSNFFC